MSELAEFTIPESIKDRIPPIARKPIEFDVYADLVDDKMKIQLYRDLLVPRLIEERMLLALRKGQISKWFSAWGQEAISVGATRAMLPDEWLLTMHRNIGVFTTRGVPIYLIFAQLMGKDTGFTRGRERSFHFGLKQFHIVGMISHVAANLPVADGIALANQLRKAGKATLAFTGEGATSEGDFHEALNIAASWELPVIIFIENNGWAISTPSNLQYKGYYFAERAKAYHVPGITIDGNNVLAVYSTVKEWAKKLRETNKGPVVIEGVTFRVRGHEEASGTKYVPKELIEYWQRRDPVITYEKWLLEKGYLSETQAQDIKKQLKEEIEAALNKALKDSTPEAKTQKLFEVYAPAPESVTKGIPPDPHAQKREIRYVDAIKEGLYIAMKRHNNLILMGQDIGEYGGVFKITEGFIKEFGKERVRNTPLCESGIVGAALGLSIAGCKAMVEMQFSDFVTYAFTQIANNLAKIYWRWGQNADVVIRMPTGAGVGAGPFHSQSTEGWLAHIPGLKIVYPSTPYDAKGLLLASFEDPNPVMFYEHKFLYRSLKGEVPEGYYTVPIGKARIVREGDDLTIITYGWGVHKALETVDKLNIDAEIIDLRSLLPYDKEAIAQSVKKTGKVLILYEDTLSYGVGAEWSAFISENLFEYLDAPIV
ncbi:MAG: dehydrogenase, partial [Chlorobi bacterium]|nr:dehydrogenase [Chlorobiota bacterium]